VQARPLAIAVRTTAKLKSEMLDDGSGDLLDAVICAVQAAWASRQRRYGIPANAPKGEGWIISA
jgi:hypothetical protein